MSIDYNIRYTSPVFVVGFHGCDKSVADRVIRQEEHLTKSSNTYDWLGNGIYFWEGSYDRALEWARDHHPINPAVVGAFIKLGNCVDLLDTYWTKRLKDVYQVLKSEYDLIGSPPPRNLKPDSNGITFVRTLDCQVMLKLDSLNNDEIAKNLGFWAETKTKYSAAEKKKIQKDENYIDSVRGMFPEGDELYPNAGYREKNHIQICLKNPNCIVGYFNPQTPNHDFKLI